MSDANWFALAGCLLSAFLVNDLIRGSTGISHLKFTRALQPVRYWACLGFTAWLATIAFIGALSISAE